MKALQLLLAAAFLSTLASCACCKKPKDDGCCGASMGDCCAHGVGDCCKDDKPKGKK
jgi:hypothetical protein